MKIIFILLMVLVSAQTYSATYKHRGLVVDVLVRQSLESYSVFYVDNFDTAGTCNTFREHVIITVPDNEKSIAVYSLLLAAYMSNKPVDISVEDTKTDADGNCIIQDVRMNANF